MTKAERTTAEIFERVFGTIINTTIDDKWFDPAAGKYFDKLVSDEAPKIQKGIMAKKILSDGRKLIMVGTRFGNVVVFQRANAVNSFGVNMPEKVKELKIVSPTCVGAGDMLRLIGAGNYGDDNVGSLIERVGQIWLEDVYTKALEKQA